jgi:hypothetical protein
MPSGEALFHGGTNCWERALNFQQCEVAALLQADGADAARGYPDDMQAALLNLWTTRHAR